VVIVTPRDWWHDCVHENKTSTVEKHTHFQKGKQTCDFCQLGFHLLSEKPTTSRFVLEKKGLESQVFSYSTTLSTFLLSTSNKGPPFRI
jgi:hypothetical protein